MSRHFEYEADDYSARTYRKPEELVSALKKLSMDNLSNLTPHRLKIWLDYTHPPVLDRIRALRAKGGASA
jgi:STE24 endopeptidase